MVSRTTNRKAHPLQGDLEEMLTLSLPVFPFNSRRIL
jgi:hypothetical protein